MSVMIQGTIWNISVMLHLTPPLGAGFIFLFSGSVFVRNITCLLKRYAKLGNLEIVC